MRLVEQPTRVAWIVRKLAEGGKPSAGETCPSLAHLVGRDHGPLW